MGKRRSVEKDINTGTWSKEEDEILFNYVTLHGEGKWPNVANFSGLKRSTKSCRYRYLNYLKPDLKRGDITKEEQDLIIKLHHQYGNRWALIAKNLPGRTDIEIKNYWKIYLSKILDHQSKMKEEKAKTSVDTQTVNDDDNDDDDNNNGQNDQIVNVEEVGRHKLKGAWSRKEDEILLNYVTLHGEGKWKKVSQRTGLMRDGKSCRYRYLQYLKSGIRRGNISKDEEDLIVRLHHLHGNRWSLIAKELPGRRDSEIKNYWHAYLSKKTQEVPGSSSSVKINEHKAKARKDKKVRGENATKITPLPAANINNNAENPVDNMILELESNHDTTSSFNPNYFDIEYDHAFLDDLLFDVFQHDQTPQIEDNMVLSSSNDLQYEIFEDDYDFWTSNGFPSFD